ncbi:transmembrane protein 6/97 [Melanogaster broomeanus]|nr:transmembrane protein 6/97 [Melanogaster broomeanus]
MTATKPRIPLSSRPLDLIYFTFFLIHLPASLLLDCQALYPSWLIPSFISGLPKMYTDFSADPLINGAMGHVGEASHFIWFKSFLAVEAFFQVPVFILGMRGLWKDSPSIYVLILVYAASTATTTLPCLAVLLATPVTSAQTIAAGIPSITSFQRLLLLSSYVPFFLLPLFMTVDMALRVLKLVQAGAAATAYKKSQ